MGRPNRRTIIKRDLAARFRRILEQTENFNEIEAWLDQRSEIVVEQEEEEQEEEELVTPESPGIEALAKSFNVSDGQILSMLLENLPIVVFVIDENWFLRVAKGEGLKQLYPDNPNRSTPNIGKSVLDLYHDYPETLEAIDKCIKGESQVWNAFLKKGTYENWGFPLKEGGMIGLGINLSSHYDLIKKSSVVLKRYGKIQKIIKSLFALSIIGAESLESKDFTATLKKWEKLLDLLMDCYNKSGLVIPLDRLILIIGTYFSSLGYEIKIKKPELQKNLGLDLAIRSAILVGEICSATQNPVSLSVDDNSGLQIVVEQNVRDDPLKLGAIAAKLISDMKAVQLPRSDKFSVIVGI